MASLHKLHGLLNCLAVPQPRVFGVTRTAVGSLAATRKDAPESTREVGDEDSYTRAPWEDELHCILNKKRLESAWVGRMIRSKTRFLSYKKCRWANLPMRASPLHTSTDLTNECVHSEWAKSQNMWNNKSEWMSWISMGEAKPSIVPSNPERHYRNQGTWISWDDFLGLDPVDPDSMDGAGI